MGYDHYSEKTKTALISYAKAWFVSAGLATLGAVIAFSQKPMFANPEDAPLLVLVGALFVAGFVVSCVAIARSARYIKLERADQKKHKEEIAKNGPA